MLSRSRARAAFNYTLSDVPQYIRLGLRGQPRSSFTIIAITEVALVVASNHDVMFATLRHREDTTGTVLCPTCFANAVMTKPQSCRLFRS